MEESRLAKREVTWSDYLRKMRQDREWADELVVRSTAYFLGKDIILATQTHGRPDSWNHIIGRDKVWPFPIKTPPLTFGYLHERHFEPIHRKPMTSQYECRGCVFTGESLKNHITQTTPWPNTNTKKTQKKNTYLLANVCFENAPANSMMILNHEQLC